MKKIMIVLICMLCISVNDVQAQSVSELKKEQQIISKIEKDVKNALLNGKSKIDLKSYKIKINEYPIMSSLIYYIPYLSLDVKGTLYYKGQYYTQLKISSHMNKKQIKDYINKIDNEISDLKTIVSKNYTDEKNALLLHDYIVSHYDYDKSLKKQSYYLSSMLLYKKGVCQSYSFLYQYILNKVNMECGYVKSEMMNHGWNIVKVGREYYHVDLTYDDSNNLLGIVDHKYFLCSDNQIKDYGYKGRNRLNIRCLNKKYDKYYFKDILSPIVIMGSDYFYIKDRFLIRGNYQGKERDVIEHVGIWKSDKGYYLNSFSGLFLRNFKLYFNKADGLYTYDLSKKTIKQLYKTNSQMLLFGIRETKNMIEMNALKSLKSSSCLIRKSFLSLI